MSSIGKENSMEEEVEKQKREAQRNKMREDIAKRKEQLRLQVIAQSPVESDTRRVRLSLFFFFFFFFFKSPRSAKLLQCLAWRPVRWLSPKCKIPSMR